MLRRRRVARGCGARGSPWAWHLRCCRTRAFRAHPVKRDGHRSHPTQGVRQLTEVTATTPAPADARRHALCLFGQAAQLFTRWCPTVLPPELCNRQTFMQYDETVLESIAASTHLVVVRDCDVSAVWRDRKAIEDALRDVHIVLLFPELQPRTNTRCWFLADRVGMTAAGSIFSCVDAMDLYKREERVDQPPMKLSTVFPKSFESWYL